MLNGNLAFTDFFVNVTFKDRFPRGFVWHHCEQKNKNKTKTKQKQNKANKKKTKQNQKRILLHRWKHCAALLSMESLWCLLQDKVNIPGINTVTLTKRS